MSCRILVFPVLAVLALSLPAPAGDLGTATPIRVGMADSMVADVAESQIDVLERKFATLMTEFTGLKGQLEVGGGPFDLANKLASGKVQLAVFQGVELAWVREKHPKFIPFMVALSTHPKIEVQILTRKDAGIDSAAGLKGKVFALPQKSKEHTHLFLEKLTAADPKSFFKEVASPASPEKALDDLVASKVDGVVADKVAVEFYKRIKPGAFGQLKVVQTSEPFPAGVVVYQEGTLTDALLNRFRAGMLKANKSERGQDLMATWNITSFESVPADYAAQLETIRKAYPSPSKTAAK